MVNFVIEEVGEEPMVSRMARVKDVNLTTLLPSHVLDEVNITDSSLDVDGAQRTVAYRPRYQDITILGHDGINTTAGFFINMENVFPCTKTFDNYLNNPICKMFTYEEDGFRNYRPIIEVADAGNQIRIFSSDSTPYVHVATYGFGVIGCPEFTKNCFPSHHETTIVCYAPCKD